MNGTAYAGPVGHAHCRWEMQAWGVIQREGEREKSEERRAKSEERREKREERREERGERREERGQRREVRGERREKRESMGVLYICVCAYAYGYRGVVEWTCMQGSSG